MIGSAREAGPVQLAGRLGESGLTGHDMGEFWIVTDPDLLTNQAWSCGDLKDC